MTTGYDGGNFAVKSVVFEHLRCGSLVLPSGTRKHDEYHAEREDRR